MENQRQKNNPQNHKEHIRLNKIIRAGVALGLAIILWFYINGTASNLITQDIENIPVKIVNAETMTKKGLSIIDQRQYYVNIRLNGTDKNIFAIKWDDISATIDMSEINDEGTYEAEVVLQGLPNSVILESVNPERITLTVEEKQQEEYAVQVVLNGKPGNGYKISSVKAEEKVLISAESSVLNKIDSVVAVVNVTDLNTDSDQYVEVNAYDEKGEVIDGLDFYPKHVLVSVKVVNTQ